MHFGSKTRIILFSVIPGARLSCTPSLLGTLDTSLRPGGGVLGEAGSKLGGAPPGFKPQTSCMRVRSVPICYGGRIIIIIFFQEKLLTVCDRRRVPPPLLPLPPEVPYSARWQPCPVPPGSVWQPCRRPLKEEEAGECRQKSFPLHFRALDEKNIFSSLLFPLLRNSKPRWNTTAKRKRCCHVFTIWEHKGRYVFPSLFSFCRSNFFFPFCV